MDTQHRYTAALRAFVLVVVVSLSLALLKTFSTWGIMLGFVLLQVGLLVSFADHPETEDSRLAPLRLRK